MARLGRCFLPDQRLHIIQRGNNRQAVFFKPDDYARYRDWLIAGAVEYGCAVQAYVLMTNHVHLLVTPAGATSDVADFSRSMRCDGISGGKNCHSRKWADIVAEQPWGLTAIQTPRSRAAV